MSYSPMRASMMQGSMAYSPCILGDPPLDDVRLDRLLADPKLDGLLAADGPGFVTSGDEGLGPEFASRNLKKNRRGRELAGPGPRGFPC
jgi:hypothetical protein